MTVEQREAECQRNTSSRAERRVEMTREEREAERLVNTTSRAEHRIGMTQEERDARGQVLCGKCEFCGCVNGGYLG